MQEREFGELERRLFGLCAFFHCILEANLWTPLPLCSWRRPLHFPGGDPSLAFPKNSYRKAFPAPIIEWLGGEAFDCTPHPRPRGSGVEKGPSPESGDLWCGTREDGPGGGRRLSRR